MLKVLKVRKVLKIFQKLNILEIRKKIDKN